MLKQIAVGASLLLTTFLRADSYIVEFHDVRTATDVHAQLRSDLALLDTRAGKRGHDPVRHEYRLSMRGAAIEVPAETAAAVLHLPYVRAVHPDTAVTKHDVPTPLSPASVIDAAARVNAGSLGTRGEGMRVAIIDTGIDYTHPALGGGFGPGHRVAGGWDFVNDDADPMDDEGHGTHVAGIVGADSAELMGVAPGVTLYGYKVLGADGRGRSSDIIAAIERSIDPNQDGNPSDRLDVINLSLGGGGTADDLKSRACDNASAAGVVVVVSAGNNGAVASVGSPGTARTAITVGATDDAGEVTGFSSRGPTPGLLTFKPDVVAPGAWIVSAKAGGGVLPLSGTSMAAPHVAGVAALLRKLHPEWTPADVKSALVTTALPTAGTPYERAAGRIDAARAHGATMFIDTHGFAFGLNPAKSGTFTASAKVKITNRGSAARTLTMAARGTPAGATITTVPESLTLPSGATGEVEVRISIDNAAMTFPDEFVTGGDIDFGGTGGFSLPWMIMRGARLTVAYDAPTATIVTFSPWAWMLYEYELGRAETFTLPGKTWDVIVASTDFVDEKPVNVRIVAAENRLVNGDELVALRRADASVRMELDARDLQNARMASAGDAEHLVSVRYRYTKNGEHFVGAQHVPSIGEVFLQPSSSITYAVFEQLFDLRNGRIISAEHPMLRDLAEPKTLTAGSSAYRHARVRWQTRGARESIFRACAVNGFVSDFFFDRSVCRTAILPRDVVVDYYTTAAGDGLVSGVELGDQSVRVPLLRGTANGIVPMPFETQQVNAYEIAHGEEIAFGRSLLFPFAPEGTTGNEFVYIPTSGLFGPAGEVQLHDTLEAWYTMYDAAGKVVASGTLRPDYPRDRPPVQAGGRYVAVREGLNVGGHVSRGELDVRFGSATTDLTAPTLTTMRLETATGRLAATVAAKSAPALVFSAADIDFSLNVTKELRAEATRVSWRISGTPQWHDAAVVITGTETGSRGSLGHMPAGVMYRADLSAATAADGTLIDLRIEIEDASGNRATWTQAPAMMIGTVATPPRRRSVR